MLIAKSDLALTSEHSLQASTSRIAKLWLDEPPGAAASFEQIFKRELQAVPAELLQIQAAPTDRASANAAENPFQAIMAMLFGLPHAPDNASVFDDKVFSAGKRFSGGMQLMALTETSETESCTFAASGNVCLADGSTRQFEVGYRMERSERSTQVGRAEFKDPLAVDFGAPRNALGSVAFDLDCDGKTENLRLPAGDAAMLFCDRNHNGTADDGSELFGPQSGDGFGELARLDGDGNGWIDGGDAAYADLMLWQIANDGANSVRSLAAAGIGALATASTATPFTLKENGATVGQVRSSSVWLGEKEGAGIVRQIDVGVMPKRTQST
ncbi:MAG: hypothetical protein A2045_02655 [Rhodocyclales bacterium GWA2_65_20]|nr:MAG: hypothetical protein A2045_02655 [Rhodocyclales bacterium GWA2_65_20]